MSNRDALRRLSQKFPADPEIEEIMNDLRAKDDMHVAIMAVSIVEAVLEKLIVTRLHKSDNEILGKLFQNRGPMGDFNSKIVVAEAFGIITGPLAAELHSMRVIRNAFAHAKLPISFQDIPVQEEVNALRMIIAIRNVKIDLPDGTEDHFTMSNKNWFLLAVRISLILIDQIAKSKGLAEEVIGKALL